MTNAAYISVSRALLAAGVAIALAGCAASAPLPAADNAPKSAALADTPRIGTLAPRKLAAGECGMFLWAKSSERNLVFFNTRGGSGQMVIGGEEVQLTRAAADGAEVLGQFENQTFKYERLSIELQIQFERRPGLARGAIIPQGALRLKRDDGWEYILPVGGLVGCEEA
jgi:hypothetical protein